MAYLADGPHRGKFVHIQPSGEPAVIERPDTYDGLRLGERTTILKLHGTIAPAHPMFESFVIAESQYVDYLATDVWHAIPAQAAQQLARTGLWFLGYAMRDWNLLVVLRRLGVLPLMRDLKAWAVQLSPDRVDVRRWERERTAVIGFRLDAYVAELQRCYDAELERYYEDPLA